MWHHCRLCCFVSGRVTLCGALSGLFKKLWIPSWLLKRRQLFLAQQGHAGVFCVDLTASFIWCYGSDGDGGWRGGGVEVSKGECWNSVIAVVRVSNLYSSSGIKIERLALRYRLLARKFKLNSKLLRLKECWCTRNLHDQPYGGICSRVVHHSVFLLGFLNQDCMEEINLFSENKTHLKQLGEQLITASNKTKETEINDKLKDVNDRWQHLFDHIEAR